LDSLRDLLGELLGQPESAGEKEEEKEEINSAFDNKPPAAESAADKTRAAG
jgi:hypothetical protein